jgi:hypothetical protein
MSTPSSNVFFSQSHLLSSMQHFSRQFSSVCTAKSWQEDSSKFAQNSVLIFASCLQNVTRFPPSQQTAAWI